MSYLIAVILIPIAILIGGTFDSETRARIGNALSDGAGRVPQFVRTTTEESGISLESLKDKGNTLIKKAGAYILRLSADRLQND